MEHHLHYMVLAFAVCIINITEASLVPVIINYVNECFTGHAQEVTTALNFYRLILGLTVPFYITPWVASVGVGWTFGMSMREALRAIPYQANVLSSVFHFANRLFVHRCPCVERPCDSAVFDAKIQARRIRGGALLWLTMARARVH